MVRICGKLEEQQRLSIAIPKRHLHYSRFFNLNKRIYFCNKWAQETSQAWLDITWKELDLGMEYSLGELRKVSHILPSVAILRAVFDDGGLDALRLATSNLGLGTMWIENAKQGSREYEEDSHQITFGQALDKESAVTRIQTLLGYEFLRPELLWEALLFPTHLRLALVGDSVLNTELRRKWYVSGEKDRSEFSSRDD